MLTFMPLYPTASSNCRIHCEDRGQFLTERAARPSKYQDKRDNQTQIEAALATSKRPHGKQRTTETE